MNWEHLLEKYRSTLYMLPLMQLASFFTIIAYFRKRIKSRYLIYLVIIAIASATEGLISNCDSLTGGKTIVTKISMFFEGFYLVLEFICCLLFIRSQIKSRLVRKIILFCPVIFLGLIAVFSILKHYYGISMQLAKYMLAIEGLIIITTGLYFYYELLKQESLNEFNQSAVWAVSGILIFFSVISPVYIFISYLLKNKSTLSEVWWINYAAYCLLFITFTLAILSDKKQRATLN